MNLAPDNPTAFSSDPGIVAAARGLRTAASFLMAGIAISCLLVLLSALSGSAYGLMRLIAVASPGIAAIVSIGMAVGFNHIASQGRIPGAQWPAQAALVCFALEAVVQVVNLYVIVNLLYGHYTFISGVGTLIIAGQIVYILGILLFVKICRESSRVIDRADLARKAGRLYVLLLVVLLSWAYFHHSWALEVHRSAWGLLLLFAFIRLVALLWLVRLANQTSNAMREAPRPPTARVRAL